MANSLPFCHTRSNSLPSRPHPISSEIDELLSRVRASEATSTSASSINNTFNDLQDMYDCVDKLLQLPLTQQTLAGEQQQKYVDELLNGSLRLLDVCSTAKDASSQTKECTQELQSALRRRKGAEMGLANELRKYISSRKAVKKAIHKVLKNLKHNSSFHKDGEIGTILQEVQAATLRVLETLLSFISGPDAESKLKSWSLVSRLIHTKQVRCEEGERHMNEIANAEATVLSLIGCKTSKAENVLKELQKSEMCIQDLEEGFECLFRRLIKVRATALNLLTQ